MNRRMFGSVAILLGFVILSSVFAAEPAPVVPGKGGPTVTVTRFFRQIEELEQQTDQALAAGDRAKLNQLLSPVFILQKADGSLASKDSLDASNSSHGALTLLHLHEVGNVLVAYVKIDGANQSSLTDVWQAVDGTSWRLRLRILPK